MNTQPGTRIRSSSHWAAFFVGIPLAVIGWGLPQAMILASGYYAYRVFQNSVPEMAIALIVLSGSSAIYGLDRFLESRFQKHLGWRHQVPLTFNILMLILVVAGLAIGLYLASEPPWMWLLVLFVLGLLYLCVTLPLVPSLPGVKELMGAICWVAVVYGPHPLPHNLKDAAALVGLLLLGFSNFAWASHQDHERDAGNNVATFSQIEPRLNVEMARITAAISIAAFAFAGPSPNPFQIAALAHGCWVATWRKASIDWCFLPLPCLIAWHLL